VEEAALILSGQAPPPAPAADAEPATDERIRYSPGTLFSNAVKMIQAPEAFFMNLDPEMGIGSGIVNILLWAILAGLVSAALFILGFGPTAAATVPRVAAAVVSIILVPVLALIFSFLGAAIFNILCKVLNLDLRPAQTVKIILLFAGALVASVALISGLSRNIYDPRNLVIMTLLGVLWYAVIAFAGILAGGYTKSYNAIAGIIALAPVSSALRIVPHGEILPQLYGLYLMVLASWGVHRVPRLRSWIAFGALTLIGIIGGVLTKNSSRFMALNPPQASTPAMPGGAALPQAPDQLMEQSQQILQDMNRYQNMAEPPTETLALLDAQGQTLLTQAWPKMSGPTRQSIVQGLPLTLPGQRNQSIEQVLQATQGVDEIVNQSMQMLQQMMPPEGQNQGKGR
jgi:hypothetical protein